MVLLFDDAVTLAGYCFQPLLIDDSNVATLVVNQLGLSEIACAFADAGATHAECESNELVSQP